MEDLPAFRVDLAKFELPQASVRMAPEVAGGSAVLGRGQSGVVYRTTLPGATKRSPRRLAAVKMAKAVGGVVAFDDERAALDAALLVEGLLLLGVRHQRIVGLVAIVSESTPAMLCTELMVNGDLKTYLRACRPRNAEPKAEITPVVMHQMAARLASAMAFVSKRGIIHRDIAARNVLVGDTAIDVKLADLGAARDVLGAGGECVYLSLPMAMYSYRSW